MRFYIFHSSLFILRNNNFIFRLSSMKRSIFVLTTVLLSALVSFAEEPADSAIRYHRFFAHDINYYSNLLDGSENPTRLTRNSVNSLIQASISGLFNRGEFHAIDHSSKSNNLRVDISGLQQIGKVSLDAGFSYRYSRDEDRCWNNTLYVSRHNPFFVADSIPSDMTKEEFNMYATAAFPFSDKLTGGLQLKYLTGSFADQSDPRPKVNSMRFDIIPGVSYQLNEKLTLGANAKVELFHSKLTHLIIDGLIPYTYFIMKGMGDHQIFTNADNSSYPRDYKGLNLGGAIQMLFSGDAISNFLQLGYLNTDEKAIDGGSSYEYKGGDYSAHEFSLLDRLTFGNSRLTQQNLTLKGSILMDKGLWYDQKKHTDTEHGNIHYYEILNKSKVHKNRVMDASVEYRFDRFRNNPDEKNISQNILTDWQLRGLVVFSSVEYTHYESDNYKQNYKLLHTLAEGKRYWKMGKGLLETSLTGFYTANLSDKYNNVREKLAGVFVAPAFEYEAASLAGFQVHVAYHLPVRTYGTFTWMGLHAQMNESFYLGSNKYSPHYDGASRTLMDVGIDFVF